MSLRDLCSIVVMLLAGPALADTVWLDNGDRLSGEIVLMDGGKLALKTRYAGQVLIDWKDIDTISSDKPLLIKQQGVSGQRSRTLEAAGKGMVRIVDGGSHTVPLASIRQMVPPRPLVEDLVWEGNLDVKLDSKRNDSDKDEWKLKGDTRVRHGAWRHVLAGEVEREKKDGRKVEDNWELDYDLDRFFDEHWFWRGSYSQKHDAIDNLERQSALGTGPGYQFWDDELGRFDLVAEISRWQLEWRDQPREDFTSYSLEWDYKRLLAGTRLELYSKGTVLVPGIERIDYLLDSEYGLRYRLNSWARLSFLYELDQLRTEGGTQSDRHYLIGVGVGW
ncbi:DUF481 domain-containing protein [Pseudomonas aeruginosa]|uniref:DUF481 domain-containing protein n=1 Tax=Pseudomonas aeruginosa TaxID=287 RepID=UPI00071B3632|nr:DUF481 domain-containing protein [Pseudomonas aeruginosa]KSP96402.1 hypothetical protein APB29_26655 [Pseudomonas aeruginosa]PTZ15568.1 DUF481 domain-containing protein [Pseudomonas aeruginosa]RPW52862.1 DUF481 domain-containing protein [Pseudomonas aeruginosa]HEJ5964353.1 DUF481 domain-containing protein [Pseudomonas aeruginosa]